MLQNILVSEYTLHYFKMKPEREVTVSVNSVYKLKTLDKSPPLGILITNLLNCQFEVSYGLDEEYYQHKYQNKTKIVIRKLDFTAIYIKIVIQPSNKLQKTLEQQLVQP